MKLRMDTFTTAQGTIGKLYDDQNNLILLTMEKPYLDNQKNVSCVHGGLYDLLPRHSPSQGDTYYLNNPELDVTLNDPAGRTYIQIDVANRASELLGCIAVGSGFGEINGEWAVTGSRMAKAALMILLGGERHQLEIFRH